jgi:hypothetical protein
MKKPIELKVQKREKEIRDVSQAVFNTARRCILATWAA